MEMEVLPVLLNVLQQATHVIRSKVIKPDVTHEYFITQLSFILHHKKVKIEFLIEE
jgi:hypothetical protein